MKAAASSLLVLTAVLVVPAHPAGARTINVFTYSQRESSTRARIGGSVHIGSRTSGRSGVSAPVAPSSTSPGSSTTYTGSPSHGSSPAGGTGVMRLEVDGFCNYPPPTIRACNRAAAPGGRGRRGGRGAAPIDPQMLARFAADRLALVPGSIGVSPSRQVKGLTGAPSWFWLDPAPVNESVTVVLGGERVIVTAVPSRVVWAFGDGNELTGGPGHPYREQTDRREAVRHRYRTRCLPGDQGRDPYVLASCTSDGYQVQASVEWTIGFEAVGPIAATGGLPPQTTSTTISYPVTEVRGFLAREGAAR
jgi:hypothetical protein